MVDEKLINWIKESQSRGYDLDYLNSYLIGAGYPAQDVNDAIDSIKFKNQKKMQLLPQVEVKPHKINKKKNKKLWAFLIILIWAIGSLLIFLFLP